jgi:hypothetical protein
MAEETEGVRAVEDMRDSELRGVWVNKKSGTPGRTGGRDWRYKVAGVAEDFEGIDGPAVVLYDSPYSDIENIPKFFVTSRSAFNRNFEYRDKDNE